ncbi:hypothetical protein [Nocardioides sambongensis]|uniref:hypothetical protein n=1 Tax=Nocardioides sambongensis TaxID=2589074 RepID=UPI001126217F|nr:hypothetical protein [Nocardioides sambongensis]
MTTSLRLAAFAAAIAAVFGVTFLLGRAVGPVEDAVAVESHDDGHAGTAEDGHDDHAGGTVPAGTASAGTPGGLMVSQDGYTLVLDRTEVRAGRARPVTFTITGPDGAALTRYDVAHDRRLHLIAVRRDATGFQHVHPTLDRRTGTWSTALDLTSGSWRLFADFRATGADPLTLGADLSVDGPFRAGEQRATSRTTTVDGYRVTLAGDLVPGSDAELTVRVTEDGVPVTDLQPYLGAYGHLVALRSGDLAYLHVHPEGVPGDGITEPGPEVTFVATVPSQGTYHLFLDFRHDGEVRTAAFTLSTGGTAADGSGASTAPQRDDPHRHTDDH